MDTEKNVYEANMKALQLYRRDICEKLERQEKQKFFEIDTCNIEAAKDGSEILYCSKGDKVYYLNSKYAPLKEAQTWAKKCEVKNINQISIIFGMGNGMFVKALLERIPVGNTVIVYEPSKEIFELVLKKIDLVELLKNSKLRILVSGVNEEELYHLIEREVNASNFYHQNCFVLPRYGEIFPCEYGKFISEMRKAEENAYVQEITLIGLGKKSIKNSIENLKYILDGKSLKNAKETMPPNLNAIIVSAGPSLMEEIEILKKAKGKALIIAVERIVDLLLENGIVPDMIASADPIKAVPASEKMQDVQMVFLTTPPCNPKLYQKHKGIKIVCNNGGLYQNLCLTTGIQEDMVSSGGSVATFVFGVLISLGVKRIILVGQDLAFKNGKSHAGATQGGDPWRMKIEVEGVDGTTVITRQDWAMFKKDFEDRIENNPDIECIDTKNTGAKIKGTKHMSLAKVLEEYCKEEIPIQEWLKEIESVFKESDRKKALQELGLYRDELKETIEISNEAIKLCEQLKDEKGNEDSVEKLQNLTEKLTDMRSRILINDILYGYTTEMQAGVSNLESEGDLWESTKGIFEKTIEVAGEMREDLKEAIREIKEYFGEE
ncbi:MAG: motility associated factor glycosyltransferase family protein [Lachnospiraceae bacterium]|nr:motility associated factor glycosyltransferase family protein [Lachnospiraceae bacterium]